VCPLSVPFSTSATTSQKASPPHPSFVIPNPKLRVSLHMNEDGWIDDESDVKLDSIFTFCFVSSRQ